MKVNGNEIRIGNVIEHKSQLWRVVKTQHVKPGKGGAFMQAEMKDIRHGTKLNERFRATETVEKVRLEEYPYQFLFADGEQFTFMHGETYEQINIHGDMIGDAAAYLQDGMEVLVNSYEGEIISVSLPDQVVLEVTETEPVVKGQTAASSSKPAMLENGVRTMVPTFINAGDRLIINTLDGSYVEREK